MKGNIPFVNVRRLLLGYDITASELARILGCAYTTARSRLDNPQTFSLGELERVSLKAHIPMDEIRAAIRR